LATISYGYTSRASPVSIDFAIAAGAIQMQGRGQGIWEGGFACQLMCDQLRESCDPLCYTWKNRKITLPSEGKSSLNVQQMREATNLVVPSISGPHFECQFKL